MKEQYSNFPKYLSNLTIVFTFLFVICSVSNAQNNLNNEKKSVNSFKTISDSEISAPERPRVVTKNDVTKTENSEDLGEEKSKSSDKKALLLQMERQAFEILNLRRSESGLSAIKWSDDMAKIARLHSQDMAQNNYFSHQGLNGSMVNDRADLLGFSNWQAIGENIAFNRGYQKPVEFACEGWMKSPAHRENILNVRWKEAGIGAALAPDGSYYFTEVFILK
jgi:uncharacterized protein YkwD